jgi:hypothetical protein
MVLDSKGFRVDGVSRCRLMGDLFDSLVGCPVACRVTADAVAPDP